jgi:serine/threonine-protein kinase
MAPEALTAEPGAGGARGDVYSLGVIAYELLSGDLPYPGLSRSSLVEAIQKVRSSSPKPLGDRLPAARGDVETVVMKALSPEARQRYASAAELASDLERYLAGEAIAARPPTPGYLLGLFVRRHKGVTGLALSLVLAVLIGAGVSLSYAFAERAARQQAESRASELLAVNGFLRDMLSGADPFRTRGRDLTVRELLDGARQQLARDSLLPPAAQASLYDAIAGTYAAIGEPQAAAELLDAGRARLASLLPAGSLAAREFERAWLQSRYGVGKAADVLEPAAALLASWPAAGAGTALAERRARLLAMKLQANLLAELSRYEEALPLLRQAGAEARAHLPAQDVLIYQLGQDEVSVLRYMGRGAESVAAAEKLMAEESAALGQDHPLTFAARHEVAWIAQEQGRYDEALRQVRALVADLERVYGREHYATQHSVNLLGLVHLRRGELAEAETLGREAVRIATERLGANHSETLAARGNLATATWRIGKIDEAERLYRLNIQSHISTGHGEQSDAVVARNNLARLLASTGRAAQA